jgi:hypothetical protein
MNIVKLFQDVMKLFKDAQACNILADIMAIIEDLKPAPGATAEEIEANGEIIKALLAMLSQIMSNPAIMQIIMALLSGLILKPEPKL